MKPVDLQIPPHAQYGTRSLYTASLGNLKLRTVYLFFSYRKLESTYKNMTDPNIITEIQSYFPTDLQSISLAALSQDPYLLQHVQYQTEEMCLVAVKKRPSSFKFVHEQTFKICMKAMLNSVYIFYANYRYIPITEYVDFSKFPAEQEFALYERAIQTEGKALELLPDKFWSSSLFDLCIKALKQDGRAFEYIKLQYFTVDQIKEMCIVALSEYPSLLQNPIFQQVMQGRNDEEDIYTAAIRRNALVIHCILIPTYEMCLIAVGKDGTILKYIPTQTEEMCKIAVNQNAHAIH